MKKITLLPFLFGLFQIGFAQTYSTDFEELNVGDFISASDTNWISTEETDALISNIEANSGTNSVHFATATVLDFDNGIFVLGEVVNLVTPEIYTDGTFVFNVDLFVEQGKGGSMTVLGNLLGTGSNLGVYFNQEEEIEFRSLAGGSINSSISSNAWNTIRLEGNLTFDLWEIFLNDQSLGTLEVENSSVEGINFVSENPFWAGGNDIPGFFIDNVSYEYTPQETLGLDAAVFSVLGEHIGFSSDHSTAGLTGFQKSPEVVLVNLGLDELTSVTVDWTYGDQNGQETYANLNLDTGEKFQSALADITLIEGENPLEVTISNVNGQGADDNTDNDSNSENFLAATPNSDKMVLIEEATGAWCGACPAGAVIMDYFLEEYEGYVSGVAVHGLDVMEVEGYPEALNAAAYPTMKIDRASDWSLIYAVERLMVSQMAENVNGTFELSSEYDNEEFTLEVSLNASSDLEGYRVGVIMTEDNVTGTTQAYDQSNGYSGSSNTYGGYEVLPNPVPASDMEYDHVARATLGSALGIELPVISQGDSYSESFTFSVPSGQNPLEMKAITVLYRPDGSADNTKVFDLSTSVSVTEIEKDSSFRIFPNPASESVNIVLSELNNASVEMRITNISGQTVLTEQIQAFDDNSITSIDVSDLPSGLYLINLTNGDKSLTEKLILN